MYKQPSPIISFLLCLLLPCIMAKASENDYKDYLSFIQQYEHINSLIIQATYTREMTVSQFPDSFQNAKASGDYRYWYSRGLSRVDADILPADAASIFLAQRIRFSYDGNFYYIHDLTHSVFESTKNLPLAANEAPMNPALYPVSFLRGGVISELLQGFEHYQNAEEVLSNIAGHASRKDTNNQPYLYIQLKTDPALSQDAPPTKSEYRVYMSNQLTEINVPQKIEWWADDALAGVIRMDSYSKVVSENRNLYFPDDCSFIVYEGDEAILEYSAKVNKYLAQAIPQEQFTLKQPAGAKLVITPGRVIQAPNGTQRPLPELPVESKGDTLSPETDTPDKHRVGLSSLIIFFVVLVGIGILIYKHKR